MTKKEKGKHRSYIFYYSIYMEYREKMKFKDNRQISGYPERGEGGSTKSAYI